MLWEASMARLVSGKVANSKEFVFVLLIFMEQTWELQGEGEWIVSLCACLQMQSLPYFSCGSACLSGEI